MKQPVSFVSVAAPTTATFYKIARILAGMALITGVVGLLSWILNIPVLRSALPGLATTKVNTALCMTFGGGIVWLLAVPGLSGYRRQFVRWGAVAIAIISSLTLVEYLIGADFGIDQLFFADPATAPDAFPGRMSPATAICFLLVAGSILTLVERKWHRLSQLVAVLVGALSLIGIVGHFYAAESLYHTFLFSTMSFPTASGFFLLSIGLLHVQPGQGFMTIFLDAGPSGLMARRLIPIAILAPILLGWLIAQGEQAGQYDPIFAFDILILSMILVVVSLIVRYAYVIRKHDLARRKAEDALTRRNRAYRTLSECNQTLVRSRAEPQILNDICHNITHVGDYVATWFGEIHEENVALTHQSMHPEFASHVSDAPLNPVCVQGITAEALRTRQAQTTTVFPNGSTGCAEEAERVGYASVAALPVRDNGTIFGVLHVYSSAEDGFDEEELHLLRELAGDLGYGINTIRTRIAREAAEARLRYQATVLDNVSSAVIATDLDFTIVSWNKAAEEIYGWTEEEVLGTQIDPLLWSRIAGDSVENILRSLRQQGIWRGEVTQHRRDGRAIRVLSSVSFVTEANGTVSGLVAVNRDVTEYMEMKEKLLAAEMERAALEKERELITMKEEFVAMVSHDFRAPLSVIMTSGDLLKRKEIYQSQDRWLSHIERIRDQARYMSLLLNDVLTFSRARSGRIIYSPHIMNLEIFCQELFEQLQMNATPAHHFAFSSEGELGAALMDEHIIQRVLVNLISNAIKYSPDGGDVHFHIEREDKDVLFQVSDQGIGIPEKDLIHIFEPFHRAANTRAFNGTGLGMAIVHEHVSAYGGQVKVDSKEGEGTTVTVRLPYRKDAS